MAFELSNVGNYLGGIFDILGIVLLTIFVIGLFGGLLFFLYRELQYKIPVVVHKVLGDNTVVEYKDKAKKMFKNGNNEIKLKKFKEILPNPPADYYLKTKNSEKLYFRWDGTHLFVPQKVCYNSPLEFKSATYNILSQMAFRMRKANERHKQKSFWEQYMPIIVWAFVIGIVTVTLIVLFREFEAFGNGLRELAAAINNIKASQVIQ